jgi:hypothetical protein
MIEMRVGVVFGVVISLRDGHRMNRVEFEAWQKQEIFAFYKGLRPDPGSSRFPLQGSDCTATLIAMYSSFQKLFIILTNALAK